MGFLAAQIFLKSFPGDGYSPMNAARDVYKRQVMRGPLVYCLEEVDNGSSLHLLSIVKDAEVKTMYRDIAGVTMVCVELSGRKQVAKLKENTPLYYDCLLYTSYHGGWRK